MRCILCSADFEKQNINKCDTQKQVLLFTKQRVGCIVIFIWMSSVAAASALLTVAKAEGIAKHHLVQMLPCKNEFVRSPVNKWTHTPVIIYVFRHPEHIDNAVSMQCKQPPAPDDWLAVCPAGRQFLLQTATLHICLFHASLPLNVWRPVVPAAVSLISVVFINVGNHLFCIRQQRSRQHSLSVRSAIEGFEFTCLLA